MIDATEVKNKADAVETTANALLALKAAENVSTLADSKAAWMATLTAFDELSTAISNLQSELSNQGAMTL